MAGLGREDRTLGLIWDWDWDMVVWCTWLDRLDRLGWDGWDRAGHGVIWIWNRLVIV